MDEWIDGIVGWWLVGDGRWDVDGLLMVLIDTYHRKTRELRDYEEGLDLLIMRKMMVIYKAVKAERE